MQYRLLEKKNSISKLQNNK